MVTYTLVFAMLGLLNFINRRLKGQPVDIWADSIDIALTMLGPLMPLTAGLGLLNYANRRLKGQSVDRCADGIDLMLMLLPLLLLI